MIDDANPMFGYPVADWHRIFAWLPVDTYDQGWKWLRTLPMVAVPRKGDAMSVQIIIGIAMVLAALALPLLMPRHKRKSNARDH
jgi:hypothetical protein